ncbi:MAG: hypothetical protein H7Z16_03365 [Pyrinomonadaceae bacterium]|nr:hypothetical protein [Pyrinomonadaceae bacterium]
MDWITIITNLLPLIPGAGGSGVAGQATALAPIAAELIQRIKSQGSLTTEQILDRAGVTLDDSKRMLLEDLERLQGANP